MAIQSALNFIHYVMNDDEGRAVIRALGSETNLAEAVQLSQQAGYDFSVEELRQAFKLDWQMRASYYSALCDEPQSNCVQ